MILLGITGSVASLKSIDILRRLQEAHQDVVVVLTEDAERFITPLSLASFAKGSVYRACDFFKPEHAMLHIRLARQASHILVAPASAQFIAKLAHGFADCLLSCLCLATRSPITLAPAMNTAMWENLALQENVSTLQKRGMHVLETQAGLLACGEQGEGRILDPEDIVARVLGSVYEEKFLVGKKVVVTTGATREYIDPVRFISNASSGKMGMCMAEAAADLGAEVVLIGSCSGSVGLAAKGIRFLPAATSQEMLTQVERHKDMAIFVSVAAVCDLVPQHYHTAKQKKADLQRMTFDLAPDIVRMVSGWKSRPFVIGFSAQTEEVENHGRAKLTEKMLDMIFANNVNDAMGSDFNEGWLLTKHDTIHLQRMPKADIAVHIFSHVKTMLR